jgi:hypothetical protein
MYRRVLGPDNANTLNLMNSLSATLMDERKFDEAEELLHSALETQKRVFGPEHAYPALTTYNLACLAALKGNANESFRLLRQAINHAAPDVARMIETDDALKSLTGDPRFKEVVAYAKEKAKALSRLPKRANSS